jgi:hypothetical protein
MHRSEFLQISPGNKLIKTSGAQDRMLASIQHPVAANRKH